MSAPTQVAIAAIALLATVPAVADERRATFEVSASIVTGCTVATDASGRWGTIDLGTVSGAGNAIASGAVVSDGIAGLSVRCTPGTSAALTADAGDHGLRGQRRLQRSTGSEAVAYSLFANGDTTPWTTQAVALSFPVGVSDRVIPVTARAAITQPLPAGLYNDTVRVTLSF